MFDDPVRLTTKASNNRLASIREELGFNRKQMAEHVRINYSRYCELEALKYYPSKQLAERIAAALMYEVDFVFPSYLKNISKTVAVRTVPEEELISLSSREVRQLQAAETSDREQQLEEISGWLLKTLTPREEQVIRLRFAWDGGEPETMKSIAKMLGIGPSRVKQIVNRALIKLRHPSRSRHLRQFWNE